MNYATLKSAIEALKKTLEPIRIAEALDLVQSEEERLAVNSDVFAQIIEESGEYIDLSLYDFDDLADELGGAQRLLSVAEDVGVSKLLYWDDYGYRWLRIREDGIGELYEEADAFKIVELEDKTDAYEEEEEAHWRLVDNVANCLGYAGDDAEEWLEEVAENA